MNIYFENLNGKRKNVFHNLDKFKEYNSNLDYIIFYDDENKKYTLKDLPTVVQQQLSADANASTLPEGNVR